MRSSLLIRKALLGAAVGAALALAVLTIAAIRFLVAGDDIAPPSRDDIKMIVFYVGGFAVAGATIGLLRPLIRSRLTAYLAAMMGGIIVMGAIVRSDAPSFAAIDALDCAFVIGCGIFFGTAAAWGFLRHADPWAEPSSSDKPRHNELLHLPGAMFMEAIAFEPLEVQLRRRASLAF